MTSPSSLARVTAPRLISSERRRPSFYYLAVTCPCCRVAAAAANLSRSLFFFSPFFDLLDAHPVQSHNAPYVLVGRMGLWRRYGPICARRPGYPVGLLAGPSLSAKPALAISSTFYMPGLAIGFGPSKLFFSQSPRHSFPFRAVDEQQSRVNGWRCPSLPSPLDDFFFF